MEQQSRGARPIPFAGSQLTGVRHVCAFFNSADEEYGVLLPFIRDGIAAGEKAIHVVDQARHTDHLHRLSGAGIDHAAARARGQFELKTSAETYLPDGRFDPDRTLAAFDRLAETGRSAGFGPSRIVCQMGWAAEGGTDLDQLVEFESRVNDVWARHDDAVICVYDLARFGGDTVIDIMRTHPLVIVGGILHQNPYYMQPPEFLRDVRARRALRTGPTAPVS